MKKAFTLVELLVVIAIIALLMAILMPSLQAARAQAQRVVCLSHLGQLGLGWFSYAQDNDGMIMYGCVSSSYHDTKLNITYTGWVTGTSSEKGITDGALYKYVPNVKLYVCPARRDKTACLTYSIVDSMNGHRGFTWETEMPPYVSLLKVKRPASRFAFADEDATLNGTIWTTTGESYTIDYKNEAWWDKPSGKHLGGMNFSFADGHL